MERQKYHIYQLIADKLDRYKQKRDTQVEEHIQQIQETYQDENEELI